MRIANQKLEETTNELTVGKIQLQQKMQKTNQMLGATVNELTAAKSQVQTTATHLHRQTDLLSNTRSSENSVIAKIKEKSLSWTPEDLVVLLESLNARLDFLRRQLHPDRKPYKSQKLVQYMLISRTKIERDDLLEIITDINQELLESENEASSFFAETAGTNAIDSLVPTNIEAATAINANEEIEMSGVRLLDESAGSVARKRARFSVSISP